MSQLSDIAEQMMAYYQDIASHRGGGGWRAVGEKIGCSGAYARQIAMGAKPVTLDIAGEWIVAMGWVPKRAANAKQSSKRAQRRFYRPCLSVTWGETIKQSGWNIETIIAAGLKALGVNEA